MRKHLEPGARIGAFNAGLLGYFSERTVVNLDGVVNADAYHALREDWLMDYIVSKRIGYLVDTEGHIPLAGCHRSPVAECRSVALLGSPIPGFGPGQIQVLEILSPKSLGDLPPRRLP